MNKLVGRFYCERCGRRVKGPRGGSKDRGRRKVYEHNGFIPPRSLVERRCKCGSRWAEEGSAER